ncbi:MAG: hypothetical protein B7Z44_01655, partial [Caulobacter sp. 12-67-6]
MSFLERQFGLKAQGTSLRTEALAGFTTFLTMAYIVIVNPAILGQAGMPVAAVAAATCISAGIGCILMGLIANYPIALAPGMGLNAYFTYTVVIGMGVPWQTALGCVFLSGVAFLILTVAGIRQLIVGAIPRPLFSAIAAGTTPDVAQVGTTWMGEFVGLDALDPTPELIDVDKFFTGGQETTVVDGVSYAVPWYVETRLA